MDRSLITDIEVENINMRDAPDFVDAFIANAYYMGRPLTDEELDELNSDSDFVYMCIENQIY